MIEANKFRLGIFVLAALFLFVVSLFLLGVSEWFEPKIDLVTMFDESVQGLDVGSPVKLRGVTVGKVSRITIRPFDNAIRVDMVAMPSAIDPDANRGRADADFFRQYFKEEIVKGLRCRLELTSITGMKYVGLDYFHTSSATPQPSNLPEDVIYIPSTTSMLKGLTDAITKSLKEISSINFKEISEKLENSLDTINSYLKDPGIGEIIDKLQTIATNLEKVSGVISESVTKDRIEDILVNAKSTIVSVKSVAANLEETLTKEQLSEIVTETKQVLDSINGLAADVKTEIEKARIDRLSIEASEALRAIVKARGELSVTLDSLNSLLNTIDDDPSSLIRGKQAEPYFKD